MDLFKACSNSRELLENILSIIQHPILVSDLDGNILSVNYSVERVLGFSPVEMEGEKLSMIFPPEDIKFLYPNLFYIAREKGFFEGEIMLLRKSMERFFAFIMFRAYFDSALKKTLIVIAIEDIDKRRRLENTFKGLHYEDLVKIANGIAHELRNPIMSIGGFAERLYRSCKDEKDTSKYYDYLMTNLKKIEGLVKKVEFFAHLPRPSFTEESIRDVLQNAIKPYIQQIEETNIELVVNVHKATILIDRDLTIRAFSMIIENAIDALPEGGKIYINDQIEDNYLKVFFNDTGRGISEKDLPFIFNPFFTTKADGAGIDLTVVKRIMESHGGNIQVRSKKGEGTTFILSFPLERRRPLRIRRLEDRSENP